MWELQLANCHRRLLQNALKNIKPKPTSLQILVKWESVYIFFFQYRKQGWLYTWYLVTSVMLHFVHIFTWYSVLEILQGSVWTLILDYEEACCNSQGWPTRLATFREAEKLYQDFWVLFKFLRGEYYILIRKLQTQVLLMEEWIYSEEGRFYLI